MNKDQEKVVKQFLKSKDEDFKKSLQPTIESWLDSDEVDDKTKQKVEDALPKDEEVKKEDEAKPKEETPKEEVKPKEEPKQEAKVEEQPKEDKTSKALEEAMNLLKEQGEKIAELEKKLPKTASFGYSTKPKEGKAENSVEDIARKMKYTK